jgi:hypothetical protein
MERSDTIMQYIRHPRTNAKVGVLVAKALESNSEVLKIGFGWSMCYGGKRKLVFRGDSAKRVVVGGDLFNRERGMEIALGRAERGADFENAHSMVQKALPKFVERALRYFQVNPEEVDDNF